MPAKLDRCVKEVMSKPGFKAFPGRTKEQSARAVCRTVLNGKNKK